MWQYTNLKTITINLPPANSSLFPQYSPDAVCAVWPSAPCLLPISPRLHHARRDHESDRGDAATGGAADDDQENAGWHLVAEKCNVKSALIYLLAKGCQLCYVFSRCLSPTANPCSSFCSRDLEGLFHWPHWVTRGHRGAKMDCLHIPQGKI